MIFMSGFDWATLLTTTQWLVSCLNAACRASRSRGRIQNGDKKMSSVQKGSAHHDHCLYGVGSIISNFVLVKVKFDDGVVGLVMC